MFVLFADLKSIWETREYDWAWALAAGGVMGVVLLSYDTAVQHFSHMTPGAGGDRGASGWGGGGARGGAAAGEAGAGVGGLGAVRGGGTTGGGGREQLKDPFEDRTPVGLAD
jgi:hypothetical protein